MRPFKSRAKQLVNRIAKYIPDGDAHDITRALQRRALAETAELVRGRVPL